jgi:methylisocitrate lyase
MNPNPTTSPGRRLRDAWAAEPIAIAGAFDPLVARIAERMGFRAAHLSGAALSAGAGVPDVGLLSLTEFVEAARGLAEATTQLILCDADIGFGEALNVEWR